MLTGSRTTLRAITRDDLEPLRQWRNQPRLRCYFREYREISPDMQEGWYETTVLTDPNTRMFAIAARDDGRLLGACGLCWIDWRARSADFSIYLGADDLYIDDHYAPDAARLLIGYGFDELNLHRIWAEIYETDHAKQALLPNLGFVAEGRHRQTTWKEGRYVDSMFYGLLRDEWVNGASR